MLFTTPPIVLHYVMQSEAALTEVPAFAVIQKLAEDKVALQQRRDVLKHTMQELGSQYEALKTQLAENETNVQVESSNVLLILYSLL